MNSERICDEIPEKCNIKDMFLMYMVQIACVCLFFQEERVPVSTWFGTTSQAAKTGILLTN